MHARSTEPVFHFRCMTDRLFTVHTMALRASRLLSCMRWSVGIGAASSLALGASIIETETGTSFEDELLITVYPGLKKRFPHSLQRLSYPLPATSTWLKFMKQKCIAKPFAMAHYASDSVSVFELAMTGAYCGTELTHLIQPAMSAHSSSVHNNAVLAHTRTGSLFFEAIGKLGLLHAGDELFFLCNVETNNVTVWRRDKGQQDFAMHFTIESPLLIECVQYAFADEDSPIFRATFP